MLRYPPFISGYPALIRGGDLLKLHVDKLTKIQTTLGLRPEEFEELVMPVLRAYADYVHLLPASELHHHRGPGGLMRHGIEVAAFAVLKSNNAVFDHDKYPQEKSKREKPWRVAAMCAGLIHDAGKPLTDLRVTDETGEKVWAPVEESLLEWANHQSVARYYLHWNANRHKVHKHLSATMVDTLIPRKTRGWIMNAGQDIYASMVNAISGDDPNSVLTSIVSRSDSASVEQDMKRHGGEASSSGTGVPVNRLVVDAIRRLVTMGTWGVNKKGSRVWVTVDGVFIVWKQGAEDVVKEVISQGVNAIPRTPDLLANVLIDNGLADRGPDGGPYWDVAPFDLRKVDPAGFTKETYLKCLKIMSADTVFGYDHPPAAVSVTLGKDSNAITLEVNTTIEINPLVVDLAAPNSGQNSTPPSGGGMATALGDLVNNFQPTPVTGTRTASPALHKKAAAKGISLEPVDTESLVTVLEPEVQPPALKTLLVEGLDIDSLFSADELGEQAAIPADGFQPLAFTLDEDQGAFGAPSPVEALARAIKVEPPSEPSNFDLEAYLADQTASAVDLGSSLNNIVFEEEVHEEPLPVAVPPANAFDTLAGLFEGLDLAPSTPRKPRTIEKVTQGELLDTADLPSAKKPNRRRREENPQAPTLEKPVLALQLEALAIPLKESSADDSMAKASLATQEKGAPSFADDLARSAPEAMAIMRRHVPNVVHWSTLNSKLFLPLSSGQSVLTEEEVLVLAQAGWIMENFLKGGGLKQRLVQKLNNINGVVISNKAAEVIEEIANQKFEFLLTNKKRDKAQTERNRHIVKLAIQHVTRLTIESGDSAAEFTPGSFKALEPILGFGHEQIKNAVCDYCDFVMRRKNIVVIIPRELLV
ncbi:MobH family relaxase (plasmid) [Pseudomonas mandelii]|uniref:MobH family relaxase n=1 Tax=Pseudomonas mandelii TaxID=75612 RepID=UPI00398CEE2A